MQRLVFTFFAFVVTTTSSCRVDKQELGEKCRANYKCESNVCLDKICVPKRKEGEWCAPNVICDSKLLCSELEAVCRTPQWIRTKNKERALANEREQLLKSGVKIERVDKELASVEKQSAPVGAGLPVRVVTVESKGPGLAACRDDERLIGGGCNSSNYVRSSPAGFSGADTVGARWNCPAAKNQKVTSFALCQKLPAK